VQVLAGNLSKGFAIRGGIRVALEYEPILPITREEAQRHLEGSDPTEIVYALLRSAFHDDDWRWVQAQCFRLVTHEQPNVRRIAALCFGHLARIHGEIDLEVVRPVLTKLCSDSDPGVAGQAQDSLDEVNYFVARKLQ
jgi:hypothetical protein